MNYSTTRSWTSSFCTSECLGARSQRCCSRRRRAPLRSVAPPRRPAWLLLFSTCSPQPSASGDRHAFKECPKRFWGRAPLALLRRGWRALKYPVLAVVPLTSLARWPKMEGLSGGRVGFTLPIPSLPGVHEVVDLLCTGGLGTGCVCETPSSASTLTLSTAIWLRYWKRGSASSDPEGKEPFFPHPLPTDLGGPRPLG